MLCPNCHEPLRDGTQFCTHCGTRTLHDGREALNESVPTVEHARGGSGVTPPPSAGGDPVVGRVLDGKYEVIAPLGAGGMGAVYRARRVLIGDEVAVKVLHARFVDDEKLVERFRREARAAAQLHHPNVVTIHDYGEARGPEGFAYIVMELVRGESLRDLLRREGRLAPERAVSLMRDVCAGVAAAHRRDIVHRDIKPDNIIVTPADEDSPTERVKVVDFGIAKLRDMAAEGTLTEVGAMVGTLFYMSPEQCKGDPLDARADVYSLGAMLYEMLAGTPPFTAPTPTGIILKHVNEPPPSLPQDLGVPPALQSAIKRALAKDQNERQRDASEFAREIQAALAPTSLTPTSLAPTAIMPSPAGESRQSADAFFPSAAQPVTPTPPPPAPSASPAPPTAGASPTAAASATAVAGRAADTHPQPFAPHTTTPTPHTPTLPPHAQAAPPARRSRRSLAVVMLVGLLVGFGGLAILGLAVYTRRNARRVSGGVNVNTRQTAATPTPTASNVNANASPTPVVAVGDAMQRAEQKILTGTLLTGADLAGLTPAQLRLLRNTVYARYGRVFQSGDLQQYFQSRPWYHPRPDFNERALGTNDRANAELAQAFEDNGGAPADSDAATVSKEVGDALEEWADATRDRDLDAHMSHYADRLEAYYRLQNVPAAQVRADRARAFARYDDIDVKLTNVRVTPDPTGARATVTFDKTWKFDADDKSSTGAVRQQLTLVKSGGHWLITSERDLQVYHKDSEEY
ncbi:MAG: eukaryotic-like serine/threonine-protein kinase [Acidobacteriota bacterium]|nr:eukaryotic-like serine/threonine-protein kinase [Acidobacteriota bacterium]